jgi:hypothetical protein
MRQAGKFDQVHTMNILLAIGHAKAELKETL